MVLDIRSRIPILSMIMRIRMRQVLNASRPRLLTNHTSPSEMFFRLHVVDQQLAVLAVPSRFFLCDLDDREDGGAFAEDGVHLFEGAVGRFGVEEPDYGEYECVSVRVV